MSDIQKKIATGPIPGSSTAGTLIDEDVYTGVSSLKPQS